MGGPGSGKRFRGEEAEKEEVVVVTKGSLSAIPEVPEVRVISSLKLFPYREELHNRVLVALAVSEARSQALTLPWERVSLRIRGILRKSTFACHIGRRRELHACELTEVDQVCASGTVEGSHVTLFSGDFSSRSRPFVRRLVRAIKRLRTRLYLQGPLLSLYTFSRGGFAYSGATTIVARLAWTRKPCHPSASASLWAAPQSRPRAVSSGGGGRP